MADPKKIVYLELLEKFKGFMEGEFTAADSALETALKAIIGTPDEGKTIVQMIADVASDGTDGIDELKELIGEIPDSATSEDIVSYIAEAVKALADGAVATNTAAIGTLNGEVTEAGSVKKAVNDLKVEVNNTIGTVAEGTTVMAEVASAKQAGLDAASAEETRAKAAEEANAKAIEDLDALVGFEVGEGEDAPKTVVDYINSEVAKATSDAGQVASDLADEIERATQAESDLQDAIDAHKEAIDAKVTTLVGDDANKSVRTIANEELAAQLITEDAAESLNELKEIAAWIQSHPGDAAAMNKAISDLAALVGTLPEGITATTVAGYVAELVKAEEDRATGVEGGLDERLQAVETAVGEGGSVATQIKAAVDALDKTVTQTAGADGVSAEIVQEDGLLKSVSVAIAAETYDAYGAAADVQTNLNNFIATIAYATEQDIIDMFSKEEQA